ncbi:MAG: SH3 domain-containing protein [Anaerolineales bacterium]|nr:SH3 domain-containing protein [Anaerolineales bacterium]MDW8276608.1 SH3 domain-containing protein [Anaerolineales bacterium]
MMKIRALPFLFLIPVLLLSACNLPGPAPQAAPPTADPGLVSTIAAQTLQALPSATPMRTVTPTSSQTLTPTATSTPTITPTYETPTARFDTNTNCRAGPSTTYPVVVVWRKGQKTEIVGKAEFDDFWLVKTPNKKDTCWVARELIQTSGSVHLVPTVTAPPTPTAAPPKAPGWKNWTYSCTYAPGGSNATVQMVWSDNALNEDGYNVYRNNQVIAAFGPDVTAYTDTAFVTSGGSLTYYIEVYNTAGSTRSSTITVTCQ